MVVACPQCGTRFNLDESLITQATVKARCSRCQHVFRITRPEGSLLSGGEEQDLKATAIRPAAEQGGAPEALAPAAGGPAKPPEAEPSRDEPQAPPPEARAGKADSKRQAVILSIVAGCLVGLLLGTLTFWYFVEKTGLFITQAPGQPDDSLRPPLPPASPEELRNLVIELREARHRGLVHPKEGQLLVIQGEVKNLTGEPRGPIRLKATLMDSMNQPLKELSFYSGTRLTDEELLRSDPEVIKRWLATPGGRQGVKLVKPNESQEFTGVFFGVPGNLAEARHGFNIVVLEGPRFPVE